MTLLIICLFVPFSFHQLRAFYAWTCTVHFNIHTNTYMWLAARRHTAAVSQAVAVHRTAFHGGTVPSGGVSHSGARTTGGCTDSGTDSGEAEREHALADGHALGGADSMLQLLDRKQAAAARPPAAQPEAPARRQKGSPAVNVHAASVVTAVLAWTAAAWGQLPQPVGSPWNTWSHARRSSGVVPHSGGVPHDGAPHGGVSHGGMHFWGGTELPHMHAHSQREDAWCGARVVF